MDDPAARREASRRRRARASLALCLVAYLGVSLDRLGVFPPVGEDEPWIAATPYRLATQGVYGADLFAGYYGLDAHDYRHMPLFPLLEAGVFRLLGVGVVQMRLLSVMFGAVLLVGAYAAGTQLGNRATGLVAVFLLLALRFGSTADETGIVLLDSARINRYDIAVGALGLLAFWTFGRAERGAGRRAYLLSGGVVGLTGLSHLYGLFWLPALWAVLLVRRGWRAVREPAPYLLLAGVVCAWIPWAAYVARDLPDYLGQQRYVADRFDVLAPEFYADNIAREANRYRHFQLRDAQSGGALARPGAWIIVVGLPAALLLLLRRSLRRASPDATAVAVILLVQLALFAALIKIKDVAYLIAYWPLVVLLIAWLGVWLWNRTGRLPVRVLVAILGLVILVDGVGRIAHRREVMRRTSAYEEFGQRLATLVPRGARVLGLQTYWLALREHPYRSWILPILLSSPRYHHAPVTMDAALARVDPDILLVDPPMRELFEAAADPASPYHGLLLAYRALMEQRRGVFVGGIDDATYGRIEVYRLTAASE